MNNRLIQLYPMWVDYFLFALLLGILPVAVLLSLYYPNVILEQGLSHRIFYFHVSVAWVALYAPAFSSLFGILYIIRKETNWDTLSYSMSKLSLIFSVMEIIKTSGHNGASFTLERIKNNGQWEKIG